LKISLESIKKKANKEINKKKVWKMSSVNGTFLYPLPAFKNRLVRKRRAYNYNILKKGYKKGLQNILKKHIN